MIATTTSISITEYPRLLLRMFMDASLERAMCHAGKWLCLRWLCGLGGGDDMRE
jgi:hypothetical protein